MVDPTINNTREGFETSTVVQTGLQSIDAGMARSTAGDRNREMHVSESMPSSVSDLPRENLVDQGGRPLGNRALQTRQRILDATTVELENKSMRDLRVIDIARRVGSSPATFYQYFKDIEDVVLHLSEQVSQKTPEVAELVQGNWEGQEGLDRAKRILQYAFDLWKKHGPVLRVRNNAADEGDERFRDLRVKSIMPFINALAAEISASQERASQAATSDASIVEAGGARVDPMTAAMTIFAIGDRLAMYHAGMERLGSTPEQILDTGAATIQFLMTSKR